jgi:hypothetical protein
VSARDELTTLALGKTAPRAADAILAAGYSKPRTITEVVGVNTLPHESVIRTKQGYMMEKLSEGWYRVGVDYAYTPNPQWLPATVLYEGATK